jgi:curved DNA-binding protein
MKYKDYYEIMGVARDATQDEIKKAYRKLARKFHPDVSEAKDAEDRFKELGEANEVLKNPEKRKAYDELGTNWQEGQDFRPPPGWEGHGANQGFGGAGNTGQSDPHFGDFFEDLFSRGGAAGRSSSGFESGFQANGQDRHARIVIDVRDSYTGASRSLQMQVPEIMNDGRVINRQRVLNVKIPKGIRAGQQIRLKQQGGASMGNGVAGDLYLEVEFQPDDYFHAEGGDVVLNLPVAPWEAALGSKIKVPLPSGSIELTIPPGSAQGRKLRLKGKGLPGKNPGDLMVVLNIVFPPASDEKMREIYQQMRDTSSFDARATMRRS